MDIRNGLLKTAKGDGKMIKMIITIGVIWFVVALVLGLILGRVFKLNEVPKDIKL